MKARGLLLGIFGRDVRLVPSRFSYPRCGLWVGFDEFAVHQGKDGRKLQSDVTFSPSFPKGFARLDREKE